MTMFERFTPAARSVTMRAEQEGRELGYPGVTAAHLLIALAWDGGELAHRVLADLRFDRAEAKGTLRRALDPSQRPLDDDDAEALRSLGIDVEEVRRAIEASFGTGALEHAQERFRLSGRIPFTPEAKKGLELALREALRLGDRHIGPEHLLLGIVRDAGSSADALLRAQGIGPQAVRDAVDAARGTEGLTEAPRRRRRRRRTA